MTTRRAPHATAAPVSADAGRTGAGQAAEAGRSHGKRVHHVTLGKRVHDVALGNARLERGKRASLSCGARVVGRKANSGDASAVPPVPAELLVAVLEVAVAVQIGPDEIARLHITSLANLLKNILRRCITAKLINIAGCIFEYFAIFRRKELEMKTYKTA